MQKLITQFTAHNLSLIQQQKIVQHALENYSNKIGITNYTALVIIKKPLRKYERTHFLIFDLRLVALTRIRLQMRL